MVTLLDNLDHMATVTASVPGTSVTASIQFACSLDPDYGDVDIGSHTGIPLSAVKVNDKVFMDVRVNTGSKTLGVFGSCICR